MATLGDIQETINIHLSKLLASVIPTDVNYIDDSLKNYTVISSIVTEDDFRGLDFMLFKCVQQCAFDNEVLEKDILDMIMKINLKKFIRDKRTDVSSIVGEEIKSVDLTDNVFEDRVLAIVEKRLNDRYEELKAINIRPSEINLLVTQLKNLIGKQTVARILQSGIEILTKGKDIDRNYLEGLDCIGYIQQQLTSLDNRLFGGRTNDATSGVYTLDSYEKAVTLDEASKKSIRRVSDYGLTSLDEAYGGLLTTEVIAIQGMPGVGKTRMACQIAYNALVLYKEHVLVRTGEQRNPALANMIYAKHAWMKFNYYISDDEIRKGNLDEKDVIALENAKIDLLESGNYGILTISDNIIYVEDIKRTIEIINKDYPHKPVSVCVIDYLELMQSNGNNPTGKVLVDDSLIKYGLQEINTTANELALGFIILNQLTKDEIRKLLEGGDADITGGRTSYLSMYIDKGMTLSATKAQNDRNEVKFNSVKCRFGKPFKNFIADANQGVCTYKDIKGEGDFDDDDEL